jgi:photosystem II stability/assembly factor-like uncharacterized protein
MPYLNPKYVIMIKSLQVFFLSLLLSVSYGQLNLDHFKSVKVRNIGPAGMSGRITAIDVDLSNPQLIYAGAASGGVWLSENAGTSWRPIFDDQSTLAIGSIKINQKNPNEIWVGTGEGNPRNSLNTGNGIYKSIDKGKTWKLMGLENTKTIHRILIHRDNPDIVYAAALGSPWGPNIDRGVFRTTDGGKTWKKILYVNDLTGAADMIVDPSNPNKIIVAMWEHRREPWFFNSGGKGSGLYVTYDGGENWKQIKSEDGLPKGDLGRIGLAIATNKPNILYALVEAKENGLYKSTDGGLKWSLVSTKNIGDRPFYYSELYVDPANENRIYNVFTYITMSEDGGKSFKNIADYGNDVHPDHHSFWIHPTQTEWLIDGNDGGLNISRDGGANWTFSGNIPVGQFYHVNIDNDFPFNVYGGLQDNGSWVGPSHVLKRGGIRNNDFQELYFGDGFDVVPYRADSRYGYAMAQGGNVGFYDRQTGKTKFVQPVHPDSKVTLRYNWNAGIAQDPFLDCGVYFGSQFLHYSKDCGDTWDILSPDLSTNDKEKQKADKSGGLTMDATNAENHTTILTIAPSPADKNVIWVGTDDGNVQLTMDGGKNWVNHNKALTGLPLGSWIPQITVSNTNAGEAWVVANNYRRNDYTAYAYHTSNYGKTWTRIADNNKVGGFVLSLVQDHKSPNLMFMGTDAGLYVSFDKGVNWMLWNKGFPRVQVMDLKIHPREDDLVIGTFGRAIWVLDDINPLREAADKGIKMYDAEFDVIESPDAYLASYRSVDGVRFIGQGDFKGENKSIDRIPINVWKKPAPKEDDKAKTEVKSEKSKESAKDVDKPSDKKDEKKEDKKEDKATVTIYNKDNQEVRKFKRKLDDGLNKIYWGLEENGVRYPSRYESKDEDDLPGGQEVLPGIYKVVVAFNKAKDSIMVEVKDDPRVMTKDADRMAIRQMQKEYEQLVTEAKTSYDFIVAARKSMAMVDKLLDMQHDTIQKQWKKTNKPMSDGLDSLSNLFMDAEGLKGIQRNPTTLMSMIYDAQQFYSSAWSSPKSNSVNALAHARTRAKEVISAVDAFKNGAWKEYREKVKTLPVTIFKE